MSKPNIQYLAAEIARRVPAMALDSRDNNEALIMGLIAQELNRQPEPPLVPGKLRVKQRRAWLKDYVRREGITGNEDYLDHLHQKHMAQHHNHATADLSQEENE